MGGQAHTGPTLFSPDLLQHPACAVHPLAGCTSEGCTSLRVSCGPFPPQDRSPGSLRNSVPLSLRRRFLNPPLCTQFIESPWVSSIPSRALICTVVTQPASPAQNFCQTPDPRSQGLHFPDRTQRVRVHTLPVLRLNFSKYNRNHQGTFKRKTPALSPAYPTRDCDSESWGETEFGLGTIVEFCLNPSDQQEGPGVLRNSPKSGTTVLPSNDGVHRSCPYTLACTQAYTHTRSCTPEHQCTHMHVHTSHMYVCTPTFMQPLCPGHPMPGFQWPLPATTHSTVIYPSPVPTLQPPSLLPDDCSGLTDLCTVLSTHPELSGLW